MPSCIDFTLYISLLLAYNNSQAFYWNIIIIKISMNDSILF